MDYGLVWAAFALIYGLCCAPGYLWQDSGLIQYRTLRGDFIGPFGLALSHPLYYGLAIAINKIFPSYFPHNVNLISSFAGAVAIANVYLLVRVWTNATLPALIAALSLGLTHTFWRNSCIAETYSLWIALFSFELLCLLFYTKTDNMRCLYGLAIFNGLSISVHILSVIPLVCYIGMIAYYRVNRKISVKTAILILICWLLSAFPYLGLILYELIKSDDILGTIQSALFGSHWQHEVLNTSLSWHLIKTSILYCALNFPTLNILLPLIFLVKLIRGKTRRGLFANMLWVQMVLFFLFAIRYDVSDRYVFFVPFYLLFCLFIGAGAQILWESVQQKRLGFLALAFTFTPLVAYTLIPRAAQDAQVRLGTRADVPYRNDFTYFLQPWKTGYHGAERFAREALAISEPNSLICADMTTVSPLILMQQYEGVRPDVKIANPVLGLNIDWQAENQVDKILKQTSVYVVSRKPGYCPQPLLHYPMVRQGVLWRISSRENLERRR